MYSLFEIIELMEEENWEEMSKMDKMETIYYAFKDLVSLCKDVMESDENGSWLADIQIALDDDHGYLARRRDNMLRYVESLEE